MTLTIHPRETCPVLKLGDLTGTSWGDRLVDRNLAPAHAGSIVVCHDLETDGLQAGGAESSSSRLTDLFSKFESNLDCY